MAHHSVGLLPAAIERYHSLARADLAGFAADKLEEEQGHDQLSMADLRALGYDAGAAIAGVPIAPNVKDAIDHARECVHGDQPVDFIGYVYALERCVIRITRERLAKLDALGGTMARILAVRRPVLVRVWVQLLRPGHRRHDRAVSGPDGVHLGLFAQRRSRRLAGVPGPRRDPGRGSVEPRRDGGQPGSVPGGGGCSGPNRVQREPGSVARGRRLANG